MTCFKAGKPRLRGRHRSTEGLIQGQGNVLSTSSYFIQNTVAREIFEGKETQDKELVLILLKDERKTVAGKGERGVCI
jgi:hypothetical protein